MRSKNRIISAAMALLLLVALYAVSCYPVKLKEFMIGVARLCGLEFYQGRLSEKFFLTELTTAFLALLGFSLVLAVLVKWWFITPLKKIRGALQRVYRGEWGVFVGTGGIGGVRGLSADFNKMSGRIKKWRDEQLVVLWDLQKDNRFYGQLSQAILSWQCCFVREDLYSSMAQFLKRVYPEDSGGFFVKTFQDTLEPAAVWGPTPPVLALSSNNCLALWEWQSHCGPVCNSSFRCSLGSENSQVHICIPVGKKSEVIGLLQIVCTPDEPQIKMKQDWATVIVEHLGLMMANVKMNEDLHNLTLRDPLTGLFNRRFMEEALKLEIFRAARHEITLAVIMIDLDHFKAFNDTYGHPAGDALLKELGLLLQRHVRSSDIACRYGGEEFTLILTGANRLDVLRRVEALRVAARNLRVWHVYQWLNGITFSAGVAIYPDHGNTPEGLVKTADLALYRAKEIGRNRICVADEDQSWEGALSNWTLEEERLLGKQAENAGSNQNPDLTSIDWSAYNHQWEG